MATHFSFVSLVSLRTQRQVKSWLTAGFATLFFSGYALAGDKTESWVRYVAQAVKTPAAEVAPRAESVKWVQYPSVKTVNWSKPSTVGADKSNWVRFPSEKAPEQMAQLAQLVP